MKNNDEDVRTVSRINKTVRAGSQQATPSLPVCSPTSLPLLFPRRRSGPRAGRHTDFDPLPQASSRAPDRATSPPRLGARFRRARPRRPQIRCCSGGVEWPSAFAAFAAQCEVGGSWVAAAIVASLSWPRFPSFGLARFGYLRASSALAGSRFSCIGPDLENLFCKVHC